MEGYKVTFNIYAESQKEADEVSRLLGEFVDGYAQQGLAVTAERLSSIMRIPQTSPFVRSRITSFLRYGK